MTSIHIYIEELMLSTNISVYCVIMQKQNMICLQEKKNIDLWGRYWKLHQTLHLLRSV